MSEWKEFTLGDIIDLVIDYRGKTPLKLGSDWSDSGYRALSAKNIKTGQIVAHDSIRFVDEDLYHKWMKDEVKRGDILITSEAPFGQVFYWDSDEKIVLSQRLFCVRINADYDSRYVYYYMTTSRFQSEMSSRASGTTVLGLRQPELLKCNISVPSLEKQRHIASILSSLDDKIAVNKKICENLEAQAQALFKHWFVDFEPFKDGKFVESELGLIPEGWRVGTLGDVAELRKSLIKPQDNILYTHYSIPAFDDNKKPSIDEGSTIKSNKFGINDGAVLLSKLNPSTKRIWYTGNVPDNSVSSTEFLPFYSKNKEFTPFIYCYLYCDKNYREIANGAKGTTNSHQRIDANSILTRGLAYSEEVIRDFCDCCQNFMELILEANQESLRLATLRDTLLPKLMSGQIKL